MTNTRNRSTYDVIVIGAGAAGLFYAAADTAGGRKVILEKTSRPGRKLLMSGNGACNITHSGSIKDFVGRYGKAGSKIRTCLYKHNNLELMKFLEDGGVKLTEREDGKVFPASMQARDILDFLLVKAERNGYELRCNSEVTEIKYGQPAEVKLADGSQLTAGKLVIATGGASYPATGSDGSFMEVLKRDLKLRITDLKPALAPVFVQNYPFADISGVSLEDVEARVGSESTRGPLLFTHRGFSGPAILHVSQHVKTGSDLRINFLPDNSYDDILKHLKEAQPGNSKGIANYLAQTFGLPKSFTEKMCPDPSGKISSLSQENLEAIAVLLTGWQFSVSGTGGWNQAMVTAGGVSLDQVNLKEMSLTGYPEIKVIGEALDVNGETGGYNLQFAYSSALAAL